MRRPLLALLLVAAGLAVAPAAPAGPPTLHAVAMRRGMDPAAAAFRAQRSGIMLTVEGRVRRILPDDRRRSRRQRFTFQTVSGLTLTVSHNVDLAPRLAGLQPGEPLVIRGEYVWNPRGGLLHWTHHDPSGRHRGGYIERHGRRYD